MLRLNLPIEPQPRRPREPIFFEIACCLIGLSLFAWWVLS